ncbi:MAG: flagellar basal body-associated FliL family protein [Alphaproteobacteria bacterium]|nr:flagellar basal body-associated FliL family protein [Alphaproteobacteria bacterium]MBU0858409.1 flagellar basal body-associated FliL family protein [Alphaproteobacteria bacterium]
MRMVIFAVLGVLLLGGAGAGTYFFFMKPAQAAVGETEEHTEAKEAHGKKGEDGHEVKMEYVELDPLILPIVDKTGVTQTISLIVMIEVNDAAAAQKVEELAPRLTDAYIQGMYGALNKHEALQGGVIQVGMLKDRLNEITLKVMGEGVANGVLLQVVQQRPM